MQGDALGPSAAVVGIGLNVRLSKALSGRIDQPAADLEHACGRPLDRNAVLGVTVSHLVDVLESFEQHGFAPLRAEWERHHAYQGRAIALTLPSGKTEHGTARGIADDGALLFESGGTLRALHSGEISVRPTTFSDGQRARSGA